jgi:hypothetical protein
MKNNSGLIVLNYRLFSEKNEIRYIPTHNGDYPHSSTDSEIHHKRIPPPVRELIAAMVNRELTECLDLIEQLFNCDTASSLEHLRAIQGGVR